MSLPGNTLPMASSDHQSSPEHPSGGKRQDIKTTPTHKVGITTPPSPGVIGQPRLPMASGAGSNTIAATDLLAHLPGGPAAMPKSFKDAAQKHITRAPARKSGGVTPRPHNPPRGGEVRKSEPRCTRTVRLLGAPWLKIHLTFDGAVRAEPRDEALTRDHAVHARASKKSGFELWCLHQSSDPLEILVPVLICMHRCIRSPHISGEPMSDQQKRSDIARSMSIATKPHVSIQLMHISMTLL